VAFGERVGVQEVGKQGFRKERKGVKDGGVGGWATSDLKRWHHEPLSALRVKHSGGSTTNPHLLHRLDAQLVRQLGALLPPHAGQLVHRQARGELERLRPRDTKLPVGLGALGGLRRAGGGGGEGRCERGRGGEFAFAAGLS